MEMRYVNQLTISDTAKHLAEHWPQVDTTDLTKKVLIYNTYERLRHETGFFPAIRGAAEAHGVTIPQARAHIAWIQKHVTWPTAREAS